MNKNGAASQWWTALSGWMADHRVRTDHLFLYDRDRGQLERCLDRNTALDRVDDVTVDRLYRAAGQGRLGLLHPKGLQPLLLTTDPDRLFAPEKATEIRRKMWDLGLTKWASCVNILGRENAADTISCVCAMPKPLICSAFACF